MIIPRIRSIRMLENYYLLVVFEDDLIKLYNARKLFGYSIDKKLQNENFFHSAVLKLDGSGVA